MAKSKSQRMEEYRERKKQQLGDRWLKTERERVNKYRQTAQIDPEKREHIRQLSRIRQARFRNRKKTNHEAENGSDRFEETQEDPVPTPSTSEDTVTSTTDSLTIKLPFKSMKSNSAVKGRKRVSRALSRSYRWIETLEDKNEELKRKLKNAQKRLLRYERKKHERPVLTPKSKADKLLRESGIKPDDVPDIRKKLVFGECLSSEIREAKAAQKLKETEIVHKIVSGRIIKKYRMRVALRKSTGLNRKKLYIGKSVSKYKRSRLTEHRRQVIDNITQFLERDDNSRMLLGKQDAVKSGKVRVQKRVLNDYMYNLHLKFLAESAMKISRTFFYKARPKHIALVNFASRSVCLCSKHQNFSFLLRALKTYRVNSCTNPDKFVEIYKDNQASLDEMLQKIPDNEVVKFQQWKRVKLTNGKERQRVVEVNLNKTDFVQLMTETFNAFKAHIERVKEQYGAVKAMKEKLPPGHVLVQMDFSENYTCSTLKEIQSAYWNSSMVTLHPAVIYYRDDKYELKHSSYVYVSEVLHHNAAMVISIIDKMIKTVKALVPDLEYVHFWTDSPSSQYRNKTIFDIISRFAEIYGPHASWHYFETGHGKGPCDGVGGTTKRNADNAVKQGKVLIQDATDFYTWATQNEKGIHYDMITEEEYCHNKDTVDERNSEIKPVKGSMMIHAVVGVKDGHGKILVRNTTCACDDCFNETGIFVKPECGWDVQCIGTKPNLKATEDTRLNNGNQPENEATRNVCEEKNDVDVSVGDFVVVQYDDIRYCGKVIDINNNDKTVRVTFMKKCEKVKRKFKWPANEDIDWVEFDEIVQKVNAPAATSRGGRMFAFPEDVLDLLDG